ncbi:histidine kinase [Gordonia sp. VNK1]|uniref:histidine kinase n=1 Tax=Gordonia oleivorans TaxID=3156618 RepID=UPI0032B56A80
MEYWGVMVGIFLVAAVVAAVAFVRSREREPEQLRREASLARELRELGADDPVRLAAVDEYETALYQRLFFVSTVSPRVRSAVWALLGAVLAAAGGLATRGDGLYLTVLHAASLVLAGVFGLAALFFAGLAAFHAATTPRVSFTESYAAVAGADDLGAGDLGAGDLGADDVGADDADAER